MLETNAKTVLFLSELGHVARAEQFMAQHPEPEGEGYLLVTLDLPIEWELARKGIPFVSGRDFRTRDTKPMVLAEEWAAQLLGHLEEYFFTYRGVSFARVYFIPLQIYLARVLYFADIVTAVFKSHPECARCVLFVSGDEVPGLRGDDYAVAALASQSCARGLGKEVVMVRDAEPTSPAMLFGMFTIKRSFFSAAITLVNVFVRLVTRPKKVRVLVYDSWRNFAPVARQLKSGEIVMVERLEAFAAGIKNIFAYRMRFVGFGPASRTAALSEAQALFARKKEQLNHSLDYSFATFRGVSHAELLRDVLGVCVQDAVDLSLGKVDAAYAYLGAVKPDVITMRISASTLQPQFPILAQVAKAMRIPALEIQHGLNYNGPGTPSKFYNAEFLGVYGKLIREELEKSGRIVGTAPVVIGSPRFDIYAPTGVEHDEHAGEQLTIGVVAASPCLAVQLDSWDVENYFQTIADAITQHWRYARDQ
jgi:hypothetical protein